MKEDLKSERLKLGLTQNQMAERLGVKLRAYVNYEKGHREIPKPVQLLFVCLQRNG